MKSRVNRLPAVRPISDSDNANMQIRTLNVQCETSVNEYTGLYSMSSVNRDYR